MSRVEYIGRLSAVIIAVFMSSSAVASLPSLVLKEGDYLDDKLSEYSRESEAALLAQGKSYRFSFGTAPISGSPGTTTYVVSVNAAYQQALSQAYTGLARTLGADNILSETSVKTTSTTGSVEDVLTECERQKSKEAEDAPESSIMDLVKGALGAFIDSQSAEKEGEIEAVLRCASITDQRSVEDAITRGIDEAFGGARVVQTAVLEGQMGVVIAFSPDTSRVAGVLSNQHPVNQPLAAARKEVMDWVTGQMSQQSGSMIGLVGSRMFKLSNGEWAVVGFGVAPASEAALSGTTLGKQRLLSQRNSAHTSAARELARFANTTISSRESQQDIDSEVATARKLDVGGSEKIETVIERSVYKRSELLERTSSKIKLKGAANVFSQRLVDEATGVEFFLAAHAWSPSMLTNAINFRSSANAAYREGSRPEAGKASAPSSHEGGQSASVPIIEQDW